MGEQVITFLVFMSGWWLGLSFSAISLDEQIEELQCAIDRMKENRCCLEDNEIEAYWCESCEDDCDLTETKEHKPLINLEVRKDA